MRQNKNSKNKRLIIDFILSISDTTKFLNETQYLFGTQRLSLTIKA